MNEKAIEADETLVERLRRLSRSWQKTSFDEATGARSKHPSYLSVALAEAADEIERLSALPPLRAREEIARALEEAREFVRNLWRNKVLREREHCYLIAAIDRADALSRTAGQEWRDISSAPKDGRWIIARCNDHSAMFYISWGRDRNGELGWCSQTASYGDGLFYPNGDWIEAPQPRIIPAPPAAEPIVADKSEVQS